MSSARRSPPSRWLPKSSSARIEPGSAACRGRAAAARAGAALPQHPRQAHRAVLDRRAVRSHEAIRADRGGGGAASQLRRRDRRRRSPLPKPASRSAGAIRRSSTASATSWRMRSISHASGSRWRRPGPARTSPSRSPTTGRGSRPRSWTGSASPMSRAAAAAGVGHDPVSTRRADWAWASSSPRRCWSDRARRSPSRTGLSRARRDRPGALGAHRFRAKDRICDMTEL